MHELLFPLPLHLHHLPYQALLFKAKTLNLDKVYTSLAWLYVVCANPDDWMIGIILGTIHIEEMKACG